MIPYDGEFLIKDSGHYIVYSDRLKLKSLVSLPGYEVVFEFVSDPTKSNSEMNWSGDDQKRLIHFRLVNFSSSLGTGTVKRVLFFKRDDGKEIFAAIHVKSLNENTSFKLVDFCF